MDEILHVTSVTAWDAASADGHYAIPPLPDGGPAPFIHLCHPEQLAGVVERFYPPPHDRLVVLTVRPDGLPIVAEPADDADGLFPHLYGPLPVAAVTAVRSLTAALQDPAG